MKVKHIIKLNREQITEILIEALGLPDNTSGYYNLMETGDQLNTYQIFGNVELSYETELANVTNKQGSSTAR